MSVSWRDVVSVLAAILGACILLLWNSQGAAVNEVKQAQATSVAEATKQLAGVKSEVQTQITGVQSQVSQVQAQAAATSGEVQALKARVDNVEKGNDRIEKNTQRLLEILGERRK